jgi:rhomboid protease GluP
MYLSGDYAVSAGASGAVFGIFGGLLWVVIRNKGKYADLNTKGILFMIVLCLYYGISTAGVDNWGHIGGLLTGFVASIILYCF